MTLTLEWIEAKLKGPAGTTLSPKQQTALLQAMKKLYCLTGDTLGKSRLIYAARAEVAKAFATAMNNEETTP